MRILVVHQYYLRAGEGGGPRFNVMCRAWADAGHDVEVLAGQVHYASGARASSRWLERDDDGPVRVWRAYTPSTFHRSLADRAASFVGWAGAATAALAAGALARPDVVVATSPSLLAWWPGLVAAARWRAPLVLEARDLWPRSAVDLGVLAARSPTTRLLYAFERAALARADAFVGLTPAITRDTVARGLVDAPRAHTLPNGAGGDLLDVDPDLGRERARDALGWTGRFVALYAGAHGRANDLGQLLECAPLLPAEVLVVCVGEGPEKAALARRARGMENVRFMDGVGRARVAELLRAADCGLATLARADAFLTVYPNKVFDALACARPCVITIDGAARALIEGAEAGLYAPPDDPAALAAALTELAASPERARAMGRRGRALVAGAFDRRDIARRYADLLAALVA